MRWGVCAGQEASPVKRPKYRLRAVEEGMWVVERTDGHPWEERSVVDYLRAWWLLLAAWALVFGRTGHSERG